MLTPLSVGPASKSSLITQALGTGAGPSSSSGWTWLLCAPASLGLPPSPQTEDVFPEVAAACLPAGSTALLGCTRCCPAPGSTGMAASWCQAQARGGAAVQVLHWVGGGWTTV